MPAPQYIPVKKPLVLIVDDYDDALTVWTTLLQAEGFEVLTAANGPDALAAALESVPQVAVLDLALPGMSGVEVARAVRASGVARLLPLVALTGYSEPSQLQQARDAGFDVVLTKPCEPSMLLAEIRRLIASSSAVTVEQRHEQA